jgi:hypothetical protein
MYSRDLFGFGVKERMSNCAVRCFDRRGGQVHVFGQGTDGYHPTGDLILDSAGNIYGTTQAGGAQGSVMVFEIMH